MVELTPAIPFIVEDISNVKLKLAGYSKNSNKVDITYDIQVEIRMNTRNPDHAIDKNLMDMCGGDRLKTHQEFNIRLKVRPNLLVENQ